MHRSMPLVYLSATLVCFSRCLVSKYRWPYLSAWGLVFVFASLGHAQPLQERAKNTSGSFALDLYGDPLPPGAIARMGTVRGRHPQAISFVAFLPDGKSVLTVCQDQVIRIWDAKTRKEIRRFGKPPSPAPEADFLGLPARFRSAIRAVRPFHASLSANGRLLACSDQDGPMRLWDVETGKELHEIKGPGLKIPGGLPKAIPGMMGMSNLAVSPNGKIVAGTAMDGEVHLWETSTAKEIKQFAQPKNQSIGIPGDFLTFSPDGMTIVDFFVELGKENHGEGLRLWDVATGEKKLEIKMENNLVQGFKASW